MSRKIAFITGGTDGIGKALALKLLNENIEVVISGRNPDKLKNTIEEFKSKSDNQAISGILADLSKMQDVKNVCEQFLQNHDQLHYLILNANAIENKRILTEDGNEKNFAIGYLSRVLMIRKLQKVLENTVGSNILSVIGLDVSRPDFNDITMVKDFTGRKGLTRWQWAINLYAQIHNKENSVPLNLYMPGLVKTKILKNEPQPMRLFVQIMNVIMGLEPAKAAENMFKVLKEIDQKKLKNATFSYSKVRRPIKLEIHDGDTENLTLLTDKLLKGFLK